MRQYLNLLEDILDNGVTKGDRTGTGTISVFGRQLRFDLAEGFPLLTTKKVHYKSAFEEMLWMIRGETNTETLNATIWDEWADEDGELGPIYGKQWRRWNAYRYVQEHAEGYEWINGGFSRRVIDQLQGVLDTLRTNPNDRRMVVSAWNPGEIDQMALPPCHLLYQFYVANNRLSLQVYQRSCDVFLGVPFNICNYALMVHIMAAMSGFKLGELIWTGGDVHIYNNHMRQVDLQLSRSPRELPELRIIRIAESLDDWKYEDFETVGYDPHPAIKAKVSI